MFMNSQLSEYFSTENHPFVEVSSFDACSQESKLCFWESNDSFKLVIFLEKVQVLS